ncbi:MAG: hypothetical protein AAF149_15715 [Bacteroidota bacterium]
MGRTISQKTLRITSDKIRHYDNICETIGEFIQGLSDELSVGFKSLKDSGYKELLEFMGISKEDRVQLLMEIKAIEDYKVKRRKLDAFTREHSNYATGFCALAIVQIDPEDQIHYYDQAIVISPRFSVAYYNRGVSKSPLGDEEGAKSDILMALELKLNL